MFGIGELTQLTGKYNNKCKHVPFGRKRICANIQCTVKPVLNDQSQKDQKMGFKTYYCLMQVKVLQIALFECSKESILKYFRPSLSYHLLLRSLFCLF